MTTTMMNQKKWYNVLFVFLTLAFLLRAGSVYAAENTYDLNKVRLKIFHLLNFSPAENSLVPGPGSGTKATPTPATPPTPTIVSGPITTRIYILEAASENIIGSGTYDPSTSSYRLQITKTVPLKSKAEANKYVLWLSKTTVTPSVSEFITSFDTSTLPLYDKPFSKNLTEYNEVLVTEETSTTPTSPNLGAIIIKALQAPAPLTPTPPPATPTQAATPTPAGTGGSSGSGIFGTLGDFFRGIFGI